MKMGFRIERRLGLFVLSCLWLVATAPVRASYTYSNYRYKQQEQEQEQDPEAEYTSPCMYNNTPACYKQVYYDAQNAYRERYFELMNTSAIRFIYERGAGCNTNNGYGLVFETFDLFCEEPEEEEDQANQAQNNQNNGGSWFSKYGGNWFGGYGGYSGYNPYNDNPYGGDSYGNQQDDGIKYTKVCQMDREFIVRGRFNTTFDFPASVNFTLSTSICKYTGKDCMQMGNKTEIDLCGYFDEERGRNRYDEYGRYQYEGQDEDEGCPAAGEYDFEERFLLPFHVGDFRPSDQYYEELYEQAKEQYENGYWNYKKWLSKYGTAEDWEQFNQQTQNENEDQYNQAYNGYNQANENGANNAYNYPFPENYSNYFQLWQYENTTRIIDEYLNHTAKFMIRVHFYPIAPQNYAYDTIHCHIPLKVVGKNFNEQLYFRRSAYRAWEYYRTGATGVATSAALVSLLGLTLYGMKKRKLACGAGPCCGCIEEYEDDYDDDDYDDDDSIRARAGDSTESVSQFVSVDNSQVILPPRVRRPSEATPPYSIQLV